MLIFRTQELLFESRFQLRLLPEGPSNLLLSSMRYRKAALLSALQLLAALSGAGCLDPGSPQARYDQTVSAIRNGDLQKARRLATLQSGGNNVWRWKFHLLLAEVMLAEGQAEQALRLIDVSLPDNSLEARRLMLRGDAFLKLDRYREAAQALDEAGERAAAGHTLDLGVEIDLLTGRRLTLENQVAEADRILKSALTRARQMGDRYLQSVALNSLAINQIRIFHWDEASTFAGQALHLAEQIGAEHLASSALGNLGYSSAYLGNFEKAHDYSERALAIRQREGDLLGLQAVVGSIGNIYVLEGSARQAIPYYQRALLAAKQLNAPSYASAWEANLAEAFAESGDWESAAGLINQAQRDGLNDEQYRVSVLLTKADVSLGRGDLNGAERNFTMVIESAPNNPAQLWEAHAGLGSLYAQLGQRARASQHFERAIRLMEQTRSEVFQAEHRATFLSRWIRFYQNYADFLIEIGDYEKAFEVSESSRARVLAEKLGLWQEGRRPPALAVYQRASTRLQAVLMSYWIAPRRSFLWVITPRKIGTFILPGEERIRTLVDAYQNAINNLRDAPTNPNGPGTRLYTVLLAEAAELIPAGSKVILASDGPLHDLNLETLPVPGKVRRYWIEDVNVSVTPSLSLLIAPSEAKPRNRVSLLLIGDPEPASADYPRLANAHKEIAGIQAAFAEISKTVLTGADANPSAYDASQPQQYSMIHFAAHGLANHASPLDSAIVLSPRDGRFMLSARDISDQPLHARLVTIASCRSAGAKSYPGEGLIGLAWAFLRAGADNVIAGLWDISDKSTSDIMIDLYSNVANGRVPDEALRDAKLAVLRRSGPLGRAYYWGPFQDYTVVGRSP
jgi:CHAT domain-containing protein/predicted negative regulator of RcsB-dependent stress response